MTWCRYPRRATGGRVLLDSRGGALDPGRHSGYAWIPVGIVGTPGFSSAQWVFLDPRRGSRSTLIACIEKTMEQTRNAERTKAEKGSKMIRRVLLGGDPGLHTVPTRIQDNPGVPTVPTGIQEYPLCRPGSRVPPQGIQEYPPPLLRGAALCLYSAPPRLAQAPVLRRCWN